MTRCATHQNARAAWVCQGCEKTLCPDCAYPQRIRNEEISICVHCGGYGRRIMRPKHIAKFWAMFPQFLRAIFSQAGLIQLFAVALVMCIASPLPGLGSPIVAFIYVSYYFRVISSAAAGGEQLPEPDDFLGVGSLLGPVFRFALATTMIWLPACLYLYFGIGLEALEENPGAALRSPAVILLVLAGIAYFPAAVIAAAVAESAFAVLNPMITLRMIFRIPGEYALATGIWAALTAANAAVMAGIEAAAQVFWIPFVSSVLIQTLGLVVPVLNGFMLGRLIYQNHEHFGVMLAGAHEEPEFPDAMPRAKPVDYARSVQAPVEPIEIDFDR
jgi:hypothetical protein